MNKTDSVTKPPVDYLGVYYDDELDAAVFYIRYTCRESELDFEDMRRDLLKEFMDTSHVVVGKMEDCPSNEDLTYPPRFSLDSSDNSDGSVTFEFISNVEDYDNERVYTPFDVINYIMTQLENIYGKLSDYEDSSLLSRPDVFDVVIKGSDGNNYKVRRKKHDLKDLVMEFDWQDPVEPPDVESVKFTILEQVSMWLDEFLPDNATAYHIDITGQYAVDALKLINLDD